MTSQIVPNSQFVIFKHEILNELLMDFKRIKIFGNYMSNDDVQNKIENLIVWLRKTPKNIVFRVNTILSDQQIVYKEIKNVLSQYSRPSPAICTFPTVKELIIIKAWDCFTELNLPKYPYEIIVDTICGAAVLKGAHIYAPGVLGMPSGLNVGEKVSVYVDIKQACKKGFLKHYADENKLFIGNGILRLRREQIFCGNHQDISGIAIFMIDTISCIPQLNNDILPKGHVLLQNFPSIICSRILNPQPTDVVLDMCAAPGNKTTHIAALMENKGTVIALEKIKNKVKKLILHIENSGAKNVQAYCFDSTKAVSKLEKSIFEGPPFQEESFDRILLDGPCSALGQRPQIYNSLSISQLHSYVALQRKLFTSAVQLLKPGGRLVYSTCTITIAENESIIAWALKKFSNLDLESVHEKLVHLNMEQFATVGYNIDGLTDEQSNKLCRFDSENDFIGFFIACFIKK